VQGLADLFGSGEPEVTDLVHGLDPRRPSGPLRDDQRPDRLDVPVAGLGLSELTVCLRGASRLYRVHGVGFALAPAFLAVGAVHLHHVHPGPAQIAGQARTVRAGLRG
jgi:hypothetical protein